MWTQQLTCLHRVNHPTSKSKGRSKWPEGPSTATCYLYMFLKVTCSNRRFQAAFPLRSKRLNRFLQVGKLMHCQDVLNIRVISINPHLSMIQIISAPLLQTRTARPGTVAWSAWFKTRIYDFETSQDCLLTQLMDKLFGGNPDWLELYYS